MKRQHDMCQCKHPYGYHNTGGRCCGGIVNQCECKSFVSKTESIEIVWGTRSQLEDLCMERDRYKAALEYIGAMSMDEAETQAAEKAREALEKQK